MPEVAWRDYSRLITCDADWRQAEESEKQAFDDAHRHESASKSAPKEVIGMGWTMKANNSGGEFSNPTPGTVGAVCTRLIDMGTQESQFGAKRKVMVSFEIDEQRDDGKRFLVNSMYTLSFHEKASLRQVLEGWRGKSFGESEEFELPSILGKPALLNLAENDRGYVNIKSINPLPKGMPALQPEGALMVFNLDAPDWDVFGDLSERLQGRIEESPEFKQAEQRKGGGAPLSAPEPEMEAAGDFSDDIPFIHRDAII